MQKVLDLTHPHWQKNTFFHPDCFYRVTHRLPWGQTESWGGHRMHRSFCFGCEWTVTDVLWDSIRRWFWQGYLQAFKKDASSRCQVCASQPFPPYLMEHIEMMSTLLAA